MCGSQLCRPADHTGHKQLSSGQTPAMMCAGLGVRVTWSEKQWMTENTNQNGKGKYFKKLLQCFFHYFSHFVFLQTRPDVSSACLWLTQTVHCWSPGPGQFPVPPTSCDHASHQVTRDQRRRNTTKYTLLYIHRFITLNIWTLETTIFSHQKCFYKSPFPHFRFQDCETDPRSLPSSCLIVKYNTSIIFNIRNSVILRTIPKLRPPLPSHIHIWSEILQL